MEPSDNDYGLSKLLGWASLAALALFILGVVLGLVWSAAPTRVKALLVVIEIAVGAVVLMLVLRIRRHCRLRHDV